MSEAPLPAPLLPLHLLLLGYGHVAQAFLPLLASRGEWLASEYGIRPVICGIGTRRQGYYIHPEGIDTALLARESDPLSSFIEQGTRFDTAGAFIAAGKAAGAEMLLELTTLNPRDGQPALMHVQSALSSGLNVVTANKGPLAFALAELQALARSHHVQFRYESTVMDGLPIFNLAQFSLPAVGIRAFRALLNTTSSLVLSMIEQGYSLEKGIRKAQELGVAEADPWYDLDGWDAVMKTTILANALLGGQLTPQMVEREGIRNLHPDEIRAAARAGTPIRLVSQASQRNGLLAAEVRPRPIPQDDILHVGKGTTGVISLETEAMGTISLVEHEPLVLQTAYGVLSDLITVLPTIRSGTRSGRPMAS
jgi:homoserine dehydrogenase